MDKLRAAKTSAKTLRGGLPAPTEHTKIVTMGPGRLCNGCSETIEPTEKRYTVDMFLALSWRFHEECYEAWANAKH